MSLREDLDTAGDVADILAYQQRADMLATQAAQLAALRDLSNQSRVQALRAEREKTLQDTLFALRRSLPGLANAIEQTPQKVASDVVLAEQTLQLVPPEAFTALEWKELAVTVRAELDKISTELQERHGDPVVRELAELREAARAVAADERARSFQNKRDYEEAVHKREARQQKQTLIIVAIIAAGAIIFCIIAAM